MLGNLVFRRNWRREGGGGGDKMGAKPRLNCAKQFNRLSNKY